jgi:hypothetical protein
MNNRSVGENIHERVNEATRDPPVVKTYLTLFSRYGARTMCQVIIDISIHYHRQALTEYTLWVRVGRLNCDVHLGSGSTNYRSGTGVVGLYIDPAERKHLLILRYRSNLAGAVDNGILSHERVKHEE